MIVTIGHLGSRVKGMNHLFFRYFLAAIIMLQPAWKSALGQEWTQFRGPGASGHSAAKGIPVKISEKNIKWSSRLPGTGHSSPVLWENTIFLTSTDKNAGGIRYVLAVDAANGKEKWRNKQTFGT